jgi:putative transposase
MCADAELISVSFAKASHAIDDIAYKIEWVTKCRYKMFRKPHVAAACEAAIRAVVARHGLFVIELSVMPEHVHCIVRCFARLSLSYVTQLLKGGTSFILFQQFPGFRLRYPKGSLWSAGKTRRTLGLDIDYARKYVTAPHNDRFQTKLEGYPGL